MKHLDLFSGIGGFALSASWVWGDEHDIHSFVEIDPFCQKVLNKHWPDVPVHSDIKDYKHDGTAIDLLTGGFPCQPFSVAGKQRSQEDDRFLWPEMLRVIQEFRPTWIIGENVAGIINLALDQVLSDLEGEAYEVQSFLIPACGVDAPHRRDRVWIVAKSNAKRCNGRQDDKRQETAERNRAEKAIYVADTENSDRRGSNRKKNKGRRHPEAGGQGKPTGRIQYWLSEPDVGRVANGVPRRVDRLGALGNAIVPQTVVPIMQAIKNLSV